jgi:hypothetical protein
MTDPRLVPLRLRWMAAYDELQEIAELKVVPCITDPARREAELLKEIDAIEFDIRQIQFEMRAQEKYGR